MADKEFTTQLSEWTNIITDLVVRDFDLHGVAFDDYSKKCAIAAMGNIYQLVQNTDKATMSDLNTSNLREIVEQCASLKLNANAVPREVYFQLRSKKIDGEWKKLVEVGIEGDGNDALLRNFGYDVKKVYPCWLVKEGDDFAYPRHKGVEITPPEWCEHGESSKVIRVVYPVQLKSGEVQYLIAERDSVKINLIAHIRNNMMNETFGVCKDRYNATPEQKQEIKRRKDEILDEVRKCDTLEDMLACEVARPYISAAWLDTPEAMFVRKMRNNAIKKFPKDLSSIGKSSLLQIDDTYKVTREEIAENENSEEFEIVADVEAEEVAQNADN